MRGGNTFTPTGCCTSRASGGVQHEVKGALDVATFRDGLSVSDHDELAAVVVAAGLDDAEVRTVLSGDAYGDDVRRDEQEARALGITGVPFFVLDGRFGISGAQPAEHVTQVLEHAWAERSPITLMTTDGVGGACEGDSCAV